MKNLPTRSLEIEPPPGISFDWVDGITGKLSAEGCEGAMWIPLREDFLPLETADCKMIDQGPLKTFWQKLIN
jgi:penicillin-binding protein 1B